MRRAGSSREMASIELPANGTCPNCRALIPKARIVKHPTKDEALRYYDCVKCGPVMVKVHDLTPRKENK